MSKFLLLLLFAGLVIFPILVLMGTLSLITDPVPVVLEVTEPDPRVLIESKRVLKDIRRNLKTGSPEPLSFTHAQLANLMAYISHSFPAVLARYNFSDANVMLALSYKLPANPFGDYLNIITEFTNAGDLYQGSSSLGGISLSNRTLFKLAFFALGLVASDGIVENLKRLLQNAYFSDQELALGLANIDRAQLISQLKGNLSTVRELAIDENQFQQVGFYYQFLQRFVVHAKGLDEISMLDLLNALFTQAGTNSSAQTAADQNADALLAMGLLVGNYRLRTAISEITGVDGKRLHGLPRILLAERRDLPLHFIYSAVLQVLANSSISYALGELKEIGDMDRRGTGFSFTDLAADRAGVQFARMATDRSGGAYQLQKIMAVAQWESDFFPALHDLPDRLRLASFSQDFGSTASPEYKKMVAEIDRRIRQAPLYQFAD